MYVPAHFAPDDDDVRQLLAHQGAADLITPGPDGLDATMLPFVHDPDRGVLLGHFARNNDHWKRADGTRGLVIVRGPDFYVSPSWYASKDEHGRVVPTWNYMTAHVHGTVTVHDDPDWVEDVVRRLTAMHESGRPAPWSVEDAPEKYFRGQLRAIVGVEVRVERVEGKFKLSQNRPAADIDGVITALRDAGETGQAEAVASHRPDRS